MNKESYVKAVTKRLTCSKARQAEFVRDLMRDLYKSLEEEHDYLTSDEVIAEYILDYCEEELVEEDDEECSLEH